SDSVGLELSEWIGAGDWRLFFLNRDRIRAITPEDVERVATTYLKPSNRTVGQFIPTASPDRAEIPAAPDASALLKDYRGDAPIEAGELFDSSLPSVEARTVRSALQGGLRTALLPKKTRGAALSAKLTLRFGDEKSLRNRQAVANLAGGMLTSGTARHTRQQIKDEFARLRAGVSIVGSPHRADVSIRATRENFPTVLELAAECLRESNFPASEFDTLKQLDMAAYEEFKSDPWQVAFTAFNRHLSPFPRGDVRHHPTPDERIADIQATALDQAKAFYEDFYGASNGQLAVVGDFDAVQVEDLVQRLFGSWSSPRPFSRVPSPFRDVPSVNQAFETPDKANAVFLAGQNLALRDEDADYPALVLADEMIGGGFLNSRLASRVRQNEGISYSVGSNLEALALDKSATWQIFAICAPGNAARLEALIRGEIDRVLNDGFETQEIEEARSGWLRSRRVCLAKDSYLAGQMARDLYLNRTFAQQLELEEKVKALTGAEILAALRRHIDPAKLSVFKAGDFAGAKA
ncbi:MAG: insulinase family protein, partial [Thermoanaerobaculia bacterium]